jgi:hypothetical protein
MTAGAYTQLSITIADSYGSVMSAGGSLLVAHTCSLGVTSEHGNTARCAPVALACACTRNGIHATRRLGH